MNRLLLPKLMDFEPLPRLVREVFLNSQSNETIEPIWNGVAVFINKGADEYIQTHHKNACWYPLYQETIAAGGLDGRIGIVTQYEPMDRPIWGLPITGPWVRVSCHVNKHGENGICHLSSVSLDAKLCTTVPMSFYREAADSVIQAYKRKMEGGLSQAHAVSDWPDLCIV